MSLLRLQLLGPPRVWRDDQLLRFKRRKTLALLAYLGAESGLHARDVLAALLWPKTAAGEARSSVRPPSSTEMLACAQPQPGGHGPHVAAHGVALPPTLAAFAGVVRDQPLPPLPWAPSPSRRWGLTSPSNRNLIIALVKDGRG